MKTIKEINLEVAEAKKNLDFVWKASQRCSDEFLYAEDSCTSSEEEVQILLFILMCVKEEYDKEYKKYCKLLEEQKDLSDLSIFIDKAVDSGQIKKNLLKK